ncbi:MAG: ABC transporter ATP-binding protein [Pseudomonadota bacterium]
MTTLALQNITKRFKSDTVLDDLSLNVASGETLVLFGPSGAGKTVLLRLIAGAIEPDGGKVILGGADMTDVPPEDRGVGMAFQNFALFPHMSAFDNIASPLEARRQPTQTIKTGVEKIAGLLKIGHVLNHAPRALSNGQKQRTALARALAAEPKLLLLDDPLRNVDAKLRFEMRLELPRLLADQGATVVYVTQDYKEAMALGDRIAVLDGGKISQLGTPSEIYRTPADLTIAQLFGDPTINLLDVTPEEDARGVYVSLSDHRVPIDQGLSHAVGRSCVLGVRPEALSFSDAPDAIPITIEAETPLNEKTVTLVITKRGREVLLSRPAEQDAPRSGEAAMRVDTGDVLLFDKETGARIVPANTRKEQAA